MSLEADTCFCNFHCICYLSCFAKWSWLLGLGCWWGVLTVNQEHALSWLMHLPCHRFRLSCFRSILLHLSLKLLKIRDVLMNLMWNKSNLPFFNRRLLICHVRRWNKSLIPEKSMTSCFLKCKFTDNTVTKALTPVSSYSFLGKC